MKALGLRRVEDWLRRQPLWFPLTLITFMFDGSLLFKIYSFHLLTHKHIVRAVSLGIIFKVVYVGILNYLLHLYKEQLLAIAWIARLYRKYEHMRAMVLSYIREQIWYKRALTIKTHIKETYKYIRSRIFNRRSVLKVAQRFMKHGKNLS